MQKKILFLLLIVLLSGCTRINNDNIEHIDYINKIISNNNKYTNSISKGYKYYLPKGVIVDKDYDLNLRFSSNNVNLYLYVDIVSYYYKRQLNFNYTNEYSYFKKINNNNKYGYILIDKQDNQYFVKIVYNYSKIEFYTKNNLSKLINLSTIILNSIDYNDIVIDKILKNDSIFSGEITYQIEDLQQKESSFSKYLNEYVAEEKAKELPESD